MRDLEHARDRKLILHGGWVVEAVVEQVMYLCIQGCIQVCRDVRKCVLPNVAPLWQASGWFSVTCVGVVALPTIPCNIDGVVYTS